MNKNQLMHPDFGIVRIRKQKEDAYMLGLLYSRATGNKILRKSFYTAAGAEKLMIELSNK